MGIGGRLPHAVPKLVGAPGGCWTRDDNYTIPIEGRDEWLAAARRLA
jgi:hypothetical protein